MGPEETAEPALALPPEPPPARSWVRRVRLWQWALALCFVGGGSIALFYMMWASTFDISKLGEMPQRATVYDMDGNPYSRLYGENRIVVPLDKVSKYFVEALVAREDSRFYSHHGVDPHGILRAVVRNFSRGRAAEGASTLTQQLARNSLPLGGKTINRKILEAFVAMHIEHRYSKSQILEFYVNRIFYGTGLYGVETASQAYFGKPSAQLDLSESAMMAGLIRSPNRFSPLRNPEGAARERNTVLNRMASLGEITPKEADAASHEMIHPARARSSNVQENYAMDAIQRELTTLLSDEQTDEGALRIYTTIDPQLQNAATQALDAQLTKIENRPGYEHPKLAARAEGANETAGTDYLQGALVAIDNRDGAIRALVGGREYKPGAFNRALDARRQIGSSFKPFVYTAAWQKGLLPGANIDDGPIRPGELADAPTWSPQNSDNTAGGIQPAEVGLIRSRNTMSVRVGELAGLEEVRRIGEAVGLGNAIPALPVIFLGAFEATLKDLTAAYTVFPNAGVERTPYLIERIDDVDGQTLYRAPHSFRPAVLSAGPAWLTTSVLEKVMQKGTAAESRSLGFTKPAAGKTGTTNDYKDAWFVGYTTSLTCGVWVGLDRPQTIMSKGYGAALALPIWCQVMGRASAQRYPATELKPPEPLRRVRVCAYSNQLANEGCETAATAYTLDLPASMADGMIQHGSICTYHQGALLPGEILPPGSPTPPPAPNLRNPEAFPKRFLRSFRHFFGG